MVTELEVLVSTVSPSGELGATNIIYRYTQRHTYRTHTHTHIHNTHIHIHTYTYVPGR